MPDRRQALGEAVRTVGSLAAVGLAFVFAIVIGSAVGLLLDRWLGTSPWLFLLFFFFGLAAGILNVFKTASKFLK